MVLFEGEPTGADLLILFLPGVVGLRDVDDKSVSRLLHMVITIRVI